MIDDDDSQIRETAVLQMSKAFASLFPPIQHRDDYMNMLCAHIIIIVLALSCDSHFWRR